MTIPSPQPRIDRATIGPNSAAMKAESDGPRFAIVSTYFEPTSGYVEDVLAEALTRVGKVFVITSSLETPGIPGTYRGTKGQGSWVRQGDLWVLRLKPVVSGRGRVIARGVRKALERVRPDLVVQLSPSQLMPLPVTSYCRSHGTPSVYISGEHRAQRPQTGPAGWLAKASAQDLIRRAIQRYAAGPATLALGGTPETVRDLIRATGRSDIGSIRLPFDARRFRYDPGARSMVRSAKGWGDDFVTIFSGKFDRRKDLIGLIQWWGRAFSQDVHARLVLVGAGSDRYSQDVKDAACSGSLDRIEVLEFCHPTMLAELINGADLAVFPNITVGIQQAMATGIAVLVPGTDPLSNLPDPSLPEAVTQFAIRDSRDWSTVAASLRSDVAAGRTIISSRSLIVNPQRRAQRAERMLDHSAQRVADRFAATARGFGNR